MSKRWTILLVVVFLCGLMLSFGNWQGTAAQKKDSALTFEIYKDAKGEYRWRLKAGNDKILGGASHGYKAKADCKAAVEIIRSGAAKAKVEEVKATDGK